MVTAMRDIVAGSIAAIEGTRDEAIAAFARALEFRFLRLDRAVVQALYATVVGRDVPEARTASDEAHATLTEIGATAYLELFAAGMPPADERKAAGT